MSAPNGVSNLGRDSLNKVNMINGVFRRQMNLTDCVMPESTAVFRGERAVNAAEILLQDFLDKRIILFRFRNGDRELPFLLLQGIIFCAVVIPVDSPFLEKDVQPVHFLFNLFFGPGLWALFFLFLLRFWLSLCLFVQMRSIIALLHL